MDCKFIYHPPGQVLRCVCTQCGREDIDRAPIAERHRNCGNLSDLRPPSSDLSLCLHLGPETGEKVACRPCSGLDLEPIHRCLLHGDLVTRRATQAGKADRLRDCLHCDDFFVRPADPAAPSQSGRQPSQPDA